MTLPSRRTGITFAAGAGAGALLIGVLWSAVGLGLFTSSFDMAGSLSLPVGAAASNYPAAGCHGTNGFDDIAEGAAVTVYSAHGDVVAAGSLGRGDSHGTATCSFPITVAGLPSGDAFYQVGVTNRPERVTVQAADARAGRVAVNLLAR